MKGACNPETAIGFFARRDSASGSAGILPAGLGLKIRAPKLARALTGRGGLQTARRDGVAPFLILRIQMSPDGEARCASSGGLETAAPSYASVSLRKRFLAQAFHGKTRRVLARYFSKPGKLRA